MVLLREELLEASRQWSRHVEPMKRGLIASHDLDAIRDRDLKAGFIADTQDELERESGNDSFCIRPLAPSKVGAAGFDLTVGEEIFESEVMLGNIRGIEHLRELEKNGMIKRLRADAINRVVLEPSVMGERIYYIASKEEVLLPRHLSLLVDAKSTTGRVGAMCIDKSRNYLERGQRGSVIVSVQPYAFPLEIEVEKTSLAQVIVRIRDSEFMRRNEVLADGENVALYMGEKLIELNENGRFGKEGLALSFSSHWALRARDAPKVLEPILMDARGRYNLEEYFEVIDGKNGTIMLEPRCFYLLGTRERIQLGNVCGVLSRETCETGTGLWGHFAGFIWPGFDGEITMECRSESKRLINVGDYAGFVKFDKMTRPLQEHERYAGSYQHQRTPLVPRMFC